MCCWKCSTWGQIIWFVIRDCVILPSIGRFSVRYCIEMFEPNNIILPITKKTVLTGNWMKANCEERESWTEYKIKLYPHAFVILFHSENSTFEICYPLLDIGNGYYKGQLCGQVVTTGWNSTLNFPAHVPLLLQGHLLSLRISEFNTGVARFVNSQLVSRFLPVQGLFPFCLQTAVRSLGVVVFFVVLCKKK